MKRLFFLKPPQISLHKWDAQAQTLSVPKWTLDRANGGVGETVVEVGIGCLEGVSGSACYDGDASLVHDLDIGGRDGTADEHAHFDLAQEVRLRAAEVLLTRQVARVNQFVVFYFVEIEVGARTEVLAHIQPLTGYCYSHASRFCPIEMKVPKASLRSKAHRILYAPVRCALLNVRSTGQILL